MAPRAARPPALAFHALFAGMCVLAALPFWLTHLLPMQDYPQFLLFARAFGDCHDPSSPFHGSYTTGFALSPLVLPILATRALAALSDFETAGRVMWTLYAVGLPLASLHLLRVLGRERAAVLLVFPLVVSYWVVGGFFAFATGLPLFVWGLAAGVRWLAVRSLRGGALLAVIVAASFLWHALVFAELVFALGILWLLWRADSWRARLSALWPLAPALTLFGVWLALTVVGRAPGDKPAAWPPFFDNAAHFFDFVAPNVREAPGAVWILVLVLVAGALARPRPAPSGAPGPRALGALAFRGGSPFGWLALGAAAGYLLLPSTCFGVEGINNRQPTFAALAFVFAWRLPARRAPRLALLAAVTAAGLFALVHFARRFRAFDRETAGASRLLDTLPARSTLLAPIGPGASTVFPGKPLAGLDLYASIRHGGLPNSSFAGYAINFIRYVDDKNPMPGIGANWAAHPGLARFDYVLTREGGAANAERAGRVKLAAEDSGFALYRVCTGIPPRCP